MKRFLLSLFFVAMGVAGYAQTGPGGVGNTLGVGQPRNVIWLDASTLGLGNGSNILTWPDLSGNANNFSATATFSPQFENTVPLNGLGYARFSKANNRIVKTALTDMPQSAYTVILVYRTSDSGDGLVSYAASDAKPDEYLLRNSDALRTYIVDAAFDQSLIATNNNTFRSLMTSWENVDGVLDYYMNGAESGGSWRNITGFKIGQTIQNGGAMAIGNDQDLLDAAYDPADAFAGDIAEVIVYDRKLNAMQVRIIHNYIAAKYNLALANNNYIGSTGANGDYDLKVIGVGRLNGTTHNEANSNGFILTGNTYTSANTFALAGHNNVANSAVATNLGAGVQQRWNRSWYIDFTAALTVDATFDIGEGIGGGSPVNKDNYVLLKLVGGVWTDQGVASANKFINGDRISFRITQAVGDGAYTLGTLDAAGSPVTGINIRTWYSYQTGNWNNPDVWTLDGGVVPLLTNPGNEIPQASDNVVITNGRTVTMNINNVTLAGMQVNGTLNVAGTSGHNFNNIEGNGRIRVSGAGGNDNFPAGTTTSFADALNGGTVEYYGNANITLNQNRTFNNAELKFNSGAIVATLMANFVLNGELRVETGTLRFNDNAAAVSRTLSVTGNVTIENNGSITTGTAGVIHEFNLQGDLNNNGGNLALTNYAVADYTTATPANGGVNANFVSSLQNQELICNGFSKFWRIKIDKGSDDTYKLRITANSVANFNLLGFAAHNNDADVTPYGAQTNNLNALGLVRGTVEIGNNIVISTLNNTGNYCVYTPATLWVNGGSVTKPAGTAIVGYGKIKVSSGTLNAPVNSGVTLRVNGTLEVEGGTVTLNQIRTSVLGANNIGGYIQNGGTVIVNTGAQGVNDDYYTFSMTYPGNVFRMGGGTLTIRRAAQTTDRGLIYINSDPQNVSITGGNIILELSHNHGNYAITSRAPFWNLTLRKTNNNTQTFKLRGGSSGDAPATTTTLAAQPLVVLNSLTIDNPTAGTNTILDAMNNDVILGKDFTLGSAAIYTTGTNTTRFNGTANGILTLGGVARTFNNFYVDKTPAATTLDIQNGLASPATAVTINGTFSAITGTLLYGSHIISAKAGVVNNATVGASANTGKVILDGAGAQAISANNGTFWNLELNNAAGVTLNTGTLNVARTLTMTAGVFNININKLVLLGNASSISGSGFGTTKMIQTSGNSSDGGLEMYYGAAGVKTYPLGTNANALLRYTPAVVQIITFPDDGYIQVNPADEILQTTNQTTGGPDILSYYWRVRSRDFAGTPTVAYNFNYADGDIGGTETNYVPGRVLDTTPFTRATDGSTNDVLPATNIIVFNGTGTANATFPGTGFPLVTASYTAGGSARFTGAPTIYYSRNTAATGFPGMRWDLAASWSTVSHTGAAAASFPQAGDVAIIGSGTPGSNTHHSIDVNSAIARAAQVVFAAVPPGTFQPRLTVQENQGVVFGRVSGPGTVMVRATDVLIPSIVGDFGDFANEPTSLYDYLSESGNLITLPTNPSVFPNLRFEGGTGTFSRRMTIPTDITVRRNLLINQQANFVLGGNATVGLNLNMSDNTPGRLEFPTNGPGYTVTIAGDINMNATGAGTNSIAVMNTVPSSLTHRLVAGGNITVTNGTIDLFNGNGATDNNAVLEFTGSASNTFTNPGGNTMDLYRIEMNKGTSIASIMTISTGFALNGPTNTATKALQLKNGLLVLDNPAISFSLTSGNGDFSIPSTAGLELKQGVVSVSGANTGILLDGLLKISGGIVNMDDAVNGGNNYIEYSATGSAQLEITAGGLVVGSQIRRGLTSTAGILKYIQSGGSVTVAKNAASQVNRGVFEIVNSGSRFSYTGGSLTFVQGINSSFVPSILIETTNFTFPNTQTITIGDPTSPAGLNFKNIGIKTNQVWGGLTIDNSSSNDPLVKLYTTPLTLAGPLTINNGATFNAQGFDLTLRHNFTNNGVYLASGNKTIFSPVGTRTVSGNGTFDIYKMDKTGTATLIMSTSLIVNNELRVLTGTISTSSNFLVAKQNVVFDATLTSTSGLGLVFEGTAKQILSRTDNVTSSTLSIVTIRNSNGVEIPDGQGYKFTINNLLRLENGVFDVGGNLLLITANGLIVPVNPFSVGNMIRTNSSFSDSGVRKIFPANYNTDFIFPVGQAHYTPITFNFGSPGRTTGSLSPTLTIRTAEEPHPAIVEDTENAPDPQIVDVNNVLQYYYTIDAENVNPANFSVDAIMKYDPAYVAVTAPYTEANYITASILTNNNPSESINKASGVINTPAKTLTFTFSGVNADQISGDYFAGIDSAIPDNVPVYQTIASGDVTDPTIFSPQPSGVPTGAIVIVNTGHELDFNVNSVKLYKTVINTGSTLDIDATYGHRLGTVSGTGTLKITSDTESAVMPAGFFEDFFGCGGGSLEFAGIGLYDIMGGITEVRNLTLSGGGQRLLANNDLHVCNDLIVTGPAMLNSNLRAIVVDNDFNLVSGSFSKGSGTRTLTVGRDLNVSGGTFLSSSAGDRILNRNLTVSGGTFNAGSGGTWIMKGNMILTGGTFNGGSGSVKFLFNNSAATQNIIGNFSGAAQLNKLEINGMGLFLNGDVDINNELLLTNGNITPDAGTTFRMNTSAAATPINGSSTSFVNGRLYKVLNSGGSFSFPIGKVTRWRYAKVNNTTAGPLTWYAEYFIGNADVLEPLVDNQLSSDASIVHVSGGEYWKVGDNTNPLDVNAQIGLSWGIQSDVSANQSNRESLRIMVWNDAISLWDNYGGTNFLAGHSQSQGDFTTATNVSFSEQIITLGTTNLANPLPVELTSFTAVMTDFHTALLKWHTASETNNDRFEVERSQNGVDFEYLGQVKGAGTSNKPHDYTVTDEQPLPGTSYYRLKQVDLDGTFAYSAIRSVTNNGERSTLKFSAYPNPVDLSRNSIVTFNKKVNVIIYNNLNRPVREYRQVESFDATGLPGGIYIIRTHTGETFKLLVR
jgi:Pentaxin family/G8 domain